MGFSNYFSKKKTPLPEVKQDPLPAEGIIQGEDTHVSCATRMPIDLIYAYLREDYEKRGYEDALANPDNAYKELNKSLIHSEFEILFKQVNRRYEDDLKEIEFHIQSRTEAGLLDVVEQLKTRRDIFLQHLTEMKGMEADLKNNTSYMGRMLFAYERGFLRGLAALSLGTFKK